MRQTLYQILRFGVVGIIGFVADLGSFSLALQFVGPYPARVLSFLGAVLCTWLLNRKFTFTPPQGRSKKQELASYFAAMCIGGAVNLAFFTVAMQFIESDPYGPHLSLAIGSIAGLFANFTSARLFVFRTAP